MGSADSALLPLFLLSRPSCASVTQYDPVKGTITPQAESVFCVLPGNSNYLENKQFTKSIELIANTDRRFVTKRLREKVKGKERREIGKQSENEKVRKG